MKRWMHKIEVLVDKAIGPCLILLLIIIVIELGFHGMKEEYHLEIPIEIADYAIIFVFVVDLIFKYLKVRHVKEFVKRYWLDILAVFPFFLLFRLFELAFGAVAVSEGARTAQTILHEGLEVEKEGAKVVREAEKFLKEGSKISKEIELVGKAERSTRFVRFLRPILRLPRFLKAAPDAVKFYEKPDGQHHVREFMPRRR